MSATLTHTETSAPVIRTIHIKAPTGQGRPLDPMALSRKLETVKREQDAANTRLERRQATRNGTFTARAPTQASFSSPTPPSLKGWAPKPPVPTKPRNYQPATQETQSTADGRPVMTHKSMFAALNLGLADLEAMTDKLEHATSKQREFLCSRCKTPETSDQHDHTDSSETKRRNYSRRRSMPAPTSHSSHLVAVKHGSQTVYERVAIPDEDPPQYHAISHRASADLSRVRSQRPPLQPHDRPDWTQQSQCGDNTHTESNDFNVPSGYIFKRRNPQAAAAASQAAPAPKQAPQQEMHLISDAVKLLKRQERNQRRKSVVDFLRKL